jgi:geranylgeranyl pyrophosphate synthase
MKAVASALKWIELSSRMTAFRAPVADELGSVDRELSRLLPNGGGLVDRVSDHVLSTKGKKFRPTLLLLTARMNGGAGRENSIAASAILELVHIATLIHDDTIDGSLLRRGKATVNSRWNEAVSIIMGDYVYSKAFKVLAELRMFDAMEILARTTHQMTIGEMEQIERKHKSETTEEDYMRVIDKKTASLISAACEMGASIAGADAESVATCAEFGRNVGLAFQIMDDILDFVGDEKTLGKPRCSDVRGGDMTLPLIAAMRDAPESAAKSMRALSSSPDLEDGALADLVGLIERHGGFSYARERAASCALAAKTLLTPFKSSPSRNALQSAAEYVVERNY